jgi:hypothetical protein
VQCNFDHVDIAVKINIKKGNLKRLQETAAAIKTDCVECMMKHVVKLILDFIEELSKKKKFRDLSK